MADNGYTIGPGDTVKELLDEINRQAIERGRKAVREASILDENLDNVPTRGEMSRELALTPGCGASWRPPKSGKPNDRYAVCSDCGKYGIEWEVISAHQK
jgi:hypothetical protein